MTLGIALLGTGNIAEHAFVPAVQAVDEARLVAVLSRDKARGAAFAQQYGIPEVYDNLEALLRSPQVDAVIVATPDATHEPQVIAAAQAGKHVLCEKPLTTTYAGCERMADAVRASGITFAMGYNNRFNSGLQHIKAMLEAGEIGPVRYARALLDRAGAGPAGLAGAQRASPLLGPERRRHASDRSLALVFWRARERWGRFGQSCASEPQ